MITEIVWNRLIPMSVYKVELVYPSKYKERDYNLTNSFRVQHECNQNFPQVLPSGFKANLVTHPNSEALQHNPGINEDIRRFK